LERRLDVAISYQKIIVPMDGSKLAECVFPHVEAIALACQVGTVELVRVVPLVELYIKGGMVFSGGEEKELNEEALREAKTYLNKVKRMLAKKGIPVTTRVLTGPTAKVLADYIDESGADLVIISTHGRSGPSRWVWGSIADRLLHSTCTPILMIRAPGCVPGF
jgi:nucleotide-binding universal stress UspA family protein